MINVDNLNYATDQFEAVIKVTFDLIAEINQKATNTTKEATDKKHIYLSLLTSLLLYLTCTPIKTAAFFDKCKLLLAQSLSAKDILAQLPAVKMSLDSM